MRYDSLPGLRVPRRPGHLPGPRRGGRLPHASTRGDFELPVELDSRVRAVAPRRPAATASSSRRPHLRGRTGRDRHRAVPGAARCRRSPSTSTRRSCSSTAATTARRARCPPGPVLVVGGGNTGYQIAEELVAHARGAPLDRRHGRRRCRSASLGRDLFRYLEAARLMRVTVDSRLGQRLQVPRDADRLEPARRPAPARHPPARPHPSASRAGRWRSPTARSCEPDAVIWATGFALDHSCVHAPVFDDGRPPRCTAAASRTLAGPVLPRPAVAVHPRLGAAGLGQGRRRIHRPADRGARRPPPCPSGGRTGTDRAMKIAYGGAGRREDLVAGER